MAPDDTTPALGEADRHRTSYNEALSRGDRASAERAFAAEYDALRRAYPSSEAATTADPTVDASEDAGSDSPAGDTLAISLDTVDADHRDAVREVIDAYAADEDAVWRDWDAILAAHPDSDLFERLEDPANDLILAAAWAKSSPHALALIERNPALLTDPAAIEAAIAEGRRLFTQGVGAATRRQAAVPSPDIDAGITPVSLPPGATARDRWIVQADQARSRMHQAHAQGDSRRAELWSAEERRLLGLAYGRDAEAGDVQARRRDPRRL